MNPDVSVAPEIAQLMEPPRPAALRSRLTVGDLARELKKLTITPDRWLSLVRFAAEDPVHVPIPTAGGYDAWLSVLPPAGAHPLDECDCDAVTVVAGELAEAGTARSLVPGLIRVHGAPGPHRAVNISDGYTVSVHVRACPGK